MGPVLSWLTMQRTYKRSPYIEPGDYTHERGSVIEYTKFGGKTVKNEWQKMTQKNGGSPVWVLVKDIKETRDGKPVERKRYNDWNRYFTEIDVSKAGKYKLPSLTADQFKKVGLNENEGNTLEQMAIHSVSQSVTGCPMPFGSIVQSYSPARERWAYCYYKAVTEWKKDDDYTDALCSSDRVMRKRTEKLREGLCFWDDAKNAGAPHFPESDENWYFHPQRFIDHLNKVITPAEFNPYEGMTYNSIYVDSSIPKGIDLSTEVKDNPGFAPYAGEGKGINGYTGITGFFDEDYLHVKRGNGKTYEESGYTVFTHEGVDFRGDSTTEIHALIFGTVLAYGDFGPYGNTIFVARKNGKGVYLLAHLSRFNTEVLERKDIAPKDILGYVGGTGGGYAPHLHITYFDWEYREDRKIVEGKGGEIITERRYGEMKDKKYNPFKHSEPKTKNDPEYIPPK